MTSIGLDNAAISGPEGLAMEHVRPALHHSGRGRLVRERMHPGPSTRPHTQPFHIIGTNDEPGADSASFRRYVPW